MEEYSVPVHNDLTDETTTVKIEALTAKDAQILALSLVFRRHGWRRASALEPQRIESEARSA